MKILKKVRRIEVKRAFVISDLINMKNGRKFHLGLISKDDFKKRFIYAKKKVLKLNEAQLDKIIRRQYIKRAASYNGSDWYIGQVKIDEVGVWKRAGGLPLSWTKSSLRETAEKVKIALDHNLKLSTRRLAKDIPNIIKTNIYDLQREKYLLSIIFKGGTGTNGRKGLKLMKGDIDDGCMRTIALAAAGVKTFRAYIGFPKKT